MCSRGNGADWLEQGQLAAYDFFYKIEFDYLGGIPEGNERTRSIL